MSATRLITAIGLVVLITGCVPSLHPLYTEKDLVFDPVLVGTWTEANESWQFRRSGEKAYDVVCNDGKAPGRFQGHLVKLGQFRFLDLYPEGLHVEANDFYKSHFMPVHTFYRISLNGNELRITPLDGDWMKSAIQRGKVSIRQEVLEDESEGEVLLSASTEELQEFVLN